MVMAWMVGLNDGPMESNRRRETVTKFVILGMVSKQTNGNDGGLFNDGGDPPCSRRNEQ